MTERNKRCCLLGKCGLRSGQQSGGRTLVATMRHLYPGWPSRLDRGSSTTKISHAVSNPRISEWSTVVLYCCSVRSTHSQRRSYKRYVRKHALDRFNTYQWLNLTPIAISWTHLFLFVLNTFGRWELTLIPPYNSHEWSCHQKVPLCFGKS